ncbi:MAG: pyridoxamine 5'-phosphate oxidase family protein [Betaproteobacteria bacterium]|nr:pyridoxamine 5'-phosphate oxidase family protein [Betaproteobacteria bacterium]
METITTTSRLREILGEPGPLTRHKIHRQMSEQAMTFVRQSPFFFLASADVDGQPTVSPKGDAAGFVHIEDPRTLLIPERPGNRLLFSLTNLLTNPRVGLIFLCPGTTETLRVGGTATLIHDTELNARFSARGKPALLLMRVELTECYFHCAKAFLRSGLWAPETWPAEMHVSFSREINLNHEMLAAAQSELDQQIAGRYKTDL